MKKILIIFAFFALLSLNGCKDSTVSQFSALGKEHIITLYGCDGKIIKQWISTGSVSNEANSDGWYFEDKATGKLIEVTGTLTIEVK